jgi:hypothetical protein
MFSDSGGTLGAGASTQVTVSHIQQPGSVTFSAPGANGSPQTFQINCKLL